MTYVPPWASKHGPYARTTGPEPAGGCARGAGASCPQNWIAGRAGGCSWSPGAAAAGTAADIAAMAATARTHTRTRNTMSGDFRLADQPFGRGKRGNRVIG